MTLRVPAGTVAVAAALVAAALVAALSTYLAYAVHPLAGVVLVAALAGFALLSRWPASGVVAGVLAVPLEPFGLTVGGAGFSPTDVALFTTAALVAFRSLTRAGHLRPAPVHLAFALWLAWISLGYLVAEDAFTLTKLLLSWVAFLLVSILVAGFSEPQVERVLLAIGVTGGVVGLVAVAGAGPQAVVADGGIATGRAQGSFEQPNVLGFFLALCLPIAIVMSSRGRPLVRVALLVCAALAGAGIALSLSRTSILGAGLALVVLLAWPGFRRTAGVALALMLVAVLVNPASILGSQQVQVVGERLSTLGRAGKVTEDPRTEIYLTTPQFIAERPVLGVGLGNYSFAADAADLEDAANLPYDHAHDVPLNVAAETGLPGLAALLIFLALVVGVARRALRTAPEQRVLALGIVAALVALIPPSLGDFPLRPNVVMATLLIEIGLLVALARSGRRSA